MSKNRFIKRNCVIVENDDGCVFFIAYENKIFIEGDSLTWQEKKDLKDIVVAIASFYGWEYEGAPKTDPKKLKKIISYIFDPDKFDPYWYCPLSTINNYHIIIRNYKREYSSTSFKLVPLPTKKHELKIGCFSIAGKKNILDICDALAECWGWC